MPKNEHFGEIDKSCYGLIELPAQEKAGLIWVHPQPKGTIDVDSLLGGLLPELEQYGWDKFEFTGESLIKMDLNWKLANDTFGESYHFPKLHANTVAKKLLPHNTSHEVFGRNHRWVFAERSIDLIREVPEKDWSILKAAYIDYFIYPNVQLLVSAGNVIIFKIYPDPADPSKSISRSWQYFDPEIVNAYKNGTPLSDGRVIAGPNAYDVDYAKGVQLSPDAMLDIMATTVRDEDYWAGASIQRVANSGRLSHILYGRNEAPAQHYHKMFCEAIGLKEAFERVS